MYILLVHLTVILTKLTFLLIVGHFSGITPGFHEKKSFSSRHLKTIYYVRQNMDTDIYAEM